MPQTTLYPLLHKRLQLLADNTETTKDVEAHEIFTITADVPAGTGVTFTLSNPIKADKHVWAVSDNYFFDAIELGGLSYVYGANTVTVTPPYFTLRTGDTVTVYYTYGAAFVSAKSVTLNGALSANVQANGDVVVTVPMTNSDSAAQPVNLSLTMDNGGGTSVTKQFAVSAPSGASAPTFTFSGLPAGTYTLSSTADLPATLAGIVVPALAPAFSYGSPTVSANGSNYTITVPVTNTGSVAGTTAVYVQLDADTKIKIGETVVPQGATQNFSYTYTGVAAGAHTLKAFQNDTTTQVGSTYNFTVAAQPVCVVPGSSAMLNYDFQNSVPYFFYWNSFSAAIGKIYNWPNYSTNNRLFIEFDVSTITACTAATITFTGDVECSGDVAVYRSTAADNTFSQIFNQYNGTAFHATTSHNLKATTIVLSAAAVAYINANSTMKVLCMALPETIGVFVADVKAWTIKLNLTY